MFKEAKWIEESSKKIDIEKVNKYLTDIHKDEKILCHEKDEVKELLKKEYEKSLDIKEISYRLALVLRAGDITPFPEDLIQFAEKCKLVVEQLSLSALTDKIDREKDKEHLDCLFKNGGWIDEKTKKINVEKVKEFLKKVHKGGELDHENAQFEELVKKEYEKTMDTKEISFRLALVLGSVDTVPFPEDLVKVAEKCGVVPEELSLTKLTDEEDQEEDKVLLACLLTNAKWIDGEPKKIDAGKINAFLEKVHKGDKLTKEKGEVDALVKEVDGKNLEAKELAFKVANVLKE